MHAAPQSVDANALRSMAPLCDLDEDQFQDLVARGQVVTLAKGEVIFTLGERDDRIIYLLAGDVTMVYADAIMETVRASSPRARLPLAEQLVREATATAKTNCTIFWFTKTDTPAATNTPATSAGDDSVAACPTSSSSTSQSDAAPNSSSAHDWFSVLMRGPVFARLSAQHIESLSARIETVPVKVGQVIIKQGAAANNYYFIRSGKFQILRRVEGVEHPLELAILSSGNAFGEEALITNGRRNASVIAIEDGELYRLSKHNFTTLLATPLTQKVSLEQAERLVHRGAALLDVRSAEDFKRNGLSQALHIPLSLLRANLTSLSPDRDYIAYCNTGVTSAVACFVLLHNGCRAFILSGGLDGLSAKEDHRIGRVTQDAPRRASTGVIDVKKVARRLASVPAPAKTPTVLELPQVNKQPSPPIAEQTRIQERIDAVEELAKLKAKLNSLAHDEPMRNVQLPPVAENPKAKTSHAANVSISDIRNDDQLWTKIPDPLPTPHEATGIEATASSCASQTQAGADEPIHLNWINDQALWDTVIGYRSDPRVEALLMAESRRGNESVPPPATTAALSLRSAEVDPKPTPPALRATGRIENRKVQAASTTQIRRPRSPGKWITWVVIIVAAIGFALWLLAKAGFTLDSVRDYIHNWTSERDNPAALARSGRIVNAENPPESTLPIKRSDASKQNKPPKDSRAAEIVSGSSESRPYPATVHAVAKPPKAGAIAKPTVTPDMRELAAGGASTATPHLNERAISDDRSQAAPLDAPTQSSQSIQSNPPIENESAREEPHVRGEEQIPASNLIDASPVPDSNDNAEQINFTTVNVPAATVDVNPVSEARDLTPEVSPDVSAIQSTNEQAKDTEPPLQNASQSPSEPNSPTASDEMRSPDANNHVETPSL